MTLRDRVALCLYRLRPLVEGNSRIDSDAMRDFTEALNIVEFTRGRDFDEDEEDVPGFKKRIHYAT